MAAKPMSWPTSETGAFVRPASKLRNWVRKDGPFPPEPNRYHLYIALACPWACRTLAFRKLKGLEKVIGLSVVASEFQQIGDAPDQRGWVFKTPEEEPGAIPDTVNGCKTLKELYLLSDPSYEGRYTTPVLWDKKTKTIVNNESSEIIRMFNSEFNDFAENPGLDLYPEPLRKEIDELSDFMYESINNGVYKCGFAKKQEPYEEAFDALFSALETFEHRLAGKRFLVGETLTEADVRLFQTLIRFDPVYYVHFKTNKKRIVDYPNLLNWLRRVYHYPGVAETVNFAHIKNHYYKSHLFINPFGIVPKGPVIDYLDQDGDGKLVGTPVIHTVHPQESKYL